MEEIIGTLELLQLAAPIIEALANSEPAYNDNNGYLECQYCPATSRTFTKPPLSLEDHHEDCPVRLAATWLEGWKKQQSQPTHLTATITTASVPKDINVEWK